MLFLRRGDLIRLGAGPISVTGVANVGIPRSGRTIVGIYCRSHLSISAGSTSERQFLYCHLPVLFPSGGTYVTLVEAKNWSALYSQGGDTTDHKAIASGGKGLVSSRPRRALG